jgi:DNA-binding transcriptional regulator YbjK
VSGGVDVLAVLDTMARGCALHTDKCVGKLHADWSRELEKYDQARAAVVALATEKVALVEALKELRSKYIETINDECGPGVGERWLPDSVDAALRQAGVEL